MAKNSRRECITWRCSNLPVAGEHRDPRACRPRKMELVLDMGARDETIEKQAGRIPVPIRMEP